MDCCIVFEGDGDLWKDSMKFRAICEDTNDAINLILRNHKFKPEHFPELQVTYPDEVDEELENVIENHLMYDGTVKSEIADLSYIIVNFDNYDFNDWINDVTKYT